MVARAARSSFPDPKQLRGVVAQDRRPLSVRQGGGGEDVVDRMLLPGDRVIGPEHDLARADLRHQMPRGPSAVNTMASK